MKSKRHFGLNRRAFVLSASAFVQFACAWWPGRVQASTDESVKATKENRNMSEYSHKTAPTQFAEANGVRLAYRRFGTAKGTPLVFLQHFTGTMDNWDPSVTDGFAATRPVILFDNAGVSSSEGSTPSSIDGMAGYAIALIEALDLKKVDLLGFSLGGMVAQEVTLKRPDLVRKIILAGTAPQNAEGFPPFSDQVRGIFASTMTPPERLLALFFAPSSTSQAAGKAFLQRLGQRTEQRDPPVSEKVAPAQSAAVMGWAGTVKATDPGFRKIGHPALVVNGNNDIMIPTYNSYVLAQTLTNAQLIIYPDSGHGALFQYASQFVAEGTAFLER